VLTVVTAHQRASPKLRIVEPSASRSTTVITPAQVSVSTTATPKTGRMPRRLRNDV
jgi:hypothetical protein